MASPSTCDPTERFVRIVNDALHALRANNWGYLESCHPEHAHLAFGNGADIWFIYTKNKELHAASTEPDLASLLAVIFKRKIGSEEEVKIQRITADVSVCVNDEEVPFSDPHSEHEPEFRLLKTESVISIGDMDFIFHFMKDEPFAPTHCHRYVVDTNQVVLGQGGEGVVYAARHARTNQAVAVKCTFVPPGAMHREAVQLRLWYELGHHNNILSPSDWFMHPESIYNDDKLLCIVSSMAAYNSLECYVEHEGALTEFVARSVMVQIIEGLMFLHGRGILHRDMKAENILVFHKDKRGRLSVKISDFGISQYTLTMSQSVSPAGTAAWAAPELLNRQFTERSDAYGAGLIMFFILFATRPFLLLPNKRRRPLIEQISRRVSQLFLIDDSQITSESEGRRLTRSAARELITAQTREDRPARTTINLTPECRELLKALTQEDPFARPTPREARKYQWLTLGKPPSPYHAELLRWKDPLAIKARQRSIYAGTRKPINQWLPREETLYTPTEPGSRISDANSPEAQAAEGGVKAIPKSEGEEAVSNHADPTCVDAHAEAAVNIVDRDSDIVDGQGEETVTVVAPVLRRSLRVREQRGARVTRAPVKALPKAKKGQTVRRQQQEMTRAGDKRKLLHPDAEATNKKRRV
ncbi:kinase-like protein [Punctularia strigosozonata HHB-11173 SS5]|uniref:kinase-like protein n=1 Tax=Punctularia strigosozonata (strain HHB-11173) TaxID=741275 RepID=UPI0004417DD2|nr:kinase-like protein [Punctularia strigosozonata HHB-11173 SS5]EIN09291.1 kinase-like protein [Punctularia strigosozonata HHB-11173 SS5]